MSIRASLPWSARAMAVSLLACGAVTAVAAAETFPELVSRLQKEKPQFAERQQKMLADRYDLADRPASGVTMSRGKPLQEGVRASCRRG